MHSNKIRELFLEYFKSRDHEIVPSSSLIPANDPTLLFTNAGMVQFKEVFLGMEQRPYHRAASAQRCVRAGGKHNDLENVGYTARHHTFFEMLGNFSFGDYFKHDAIRYAWNFLTEVLQIPANRLWVTVYKDDKESENIWLNELKIDPNRFSRCGEKDNYWSMGDTGPCGPCTEIFYDHGPTIAGGPPGSATQEGDRYVEIWNLVFMQYERTLDGRLTLLPQPCVDTGMGLERVSAVLQGVHDNYDIELFQYLLRALATIIPSGKFQDKSMRVIVDHIRSTAFLIADGVVPSNEGRGYVLRRIIRRAVRHGYKLEKLKPFFYKMTQPLIEVMGSAYPELIKSQTLIEQIIEQEEIQFAKTLAQGLKMLDQHLINLTNHEIPGNLIFQLYDTYGFPPDLIADIARERNFQLDHAGFQLAMKKQREQSQQSNPFNLDQTHKIHISGETVFTGYEGLRGEAKIIALLQDSQPVNELMMGYSGSVVLDKTPFYAESGGQVGDTGYLYFNGGSFRVRDTQKHGQVFLHIGEVLKGHLKRNDLVQAEVDQEERQAIVLNHSATHLLHEALRRVLGEHVKQKGSLVEAKRLRFDFSHSKALTGQEIQSIERLVNQQVRANLPSNIRVMSPDQAQEAGALALFGERYGKQVRVLKMGEFSTEICGGTHAKSTGEIGLFKIIGESACASGVRRLEAVTGPVAVNYVEAVESHLLEIADLLKTNKANITHKIKQLLEDSSEISKALAQVKQQLANEQLADLSQEAIDIKGIKLLAIELKGISRETMRSTLDQLKHQLKSAVILLATIKENQIQLVAGVTKDVLKFFNAIELLNFVTEQVDGKGGGRPEMAQGGGDMPSALPEALKRIPTWVKEKISCP